MVEGGKCYSLPLVSRLDRLDSQMKYIEEKEELPNCQGGAAALVLWGEWIDNGSHWKWQRGRPTPEASAGPSGVS